MFFDLHQEAALHAREEPPVIEIAPEDEIVVDVFWALGTQWRVIAGRTDFLYQGLEYSAARDTLDMMGIDRSQWPYIFNGLRIMESAAKPVLNKKDGW